MNEKYLPLLKLGILISGYALWYLIFVIIHMFANLDLAYIYFSNWDPIARILCVLCCMRMTYMAVFSDDDWSEITNNKEDIK